MVWKTQTLCATVKPSTVIYSIMRDRSALMGRWEGPEVTFWLTSTPPRPTPRSSSPSQRGRTLRKFVEVLRGRLARSHPLAEQLSAEVNDRGDSDTV